MRDFHDEDLAPREQETELVAAAQPVALPAIKAIAGSASAILLLLRVTAERSFAFLVFPDGQIETVEMARFAKADNRSLAVMPLHACSWESCGRRT